MTTVDQLLEDARQHLPRRASPEETLREMQSGALVVDIRGDEQQRRDGLMPGALVIRRNVLEWRCDPKSEWRHPDVKRHDQRIIVVCHEGYQSSLAAATLQQMGMKQAIDMDGGFRLWRDRGLPVVPYGERRLLSDGVRALLRRVWKMAAGREGPRITNQRHIKRVSHAIQRLESNFSNPSNS
jgi:rhodanese-related sulfurtransferase